MNKLFPRALDVRINAWLCCLAMVLLSACSGGEAARQQPQLAADVAAVPSPGIAPGEPPPTPAPNPSPNGTPSDDDVGGLYWWLLGRAPSAADLLFWQASNLGLDEIAFQLKKSPELVDRHAWSSIGQNTRTRIYVDASATGERPDGSEANPYKTLAAAARAVKGPSTTIFVKPGVYEGGLRTSTDGADTVAGGYDGRIYWVSTMRWGAKIVPAPASTNEADNSTGWTNTGNYVHIVGFEVDGSSSASATRDNWRQGIYTSGSRSVVRENYVHDIARWYSCSSGSGGAGINIDAYDNGGLSDAVGNWVRDIGRDAAGCNRFQGIYVSSSGSVVNNVVYRAYRGAAIHLYHEANAVKVINNTVAASYVGIVVGTGAYRGPKVEHKDTLVYNNIAYDNYIGIEEYVGSGGIMGVNYYRNNLLAQNTRDWGPMRNTATGTLTADPAFVRYEKAMLLPNFHLASHSAAIDSGTTSNALANDFDGRTRDPSNGSCIGAYEAPQ